MSPPQKSSSKASSDEDAHAKSTHAKKARVLILGAGPSGMAAAMELYKKDISLEMVEKNDRVGGLARTISFGEFRTDIGPHRFFSKNPYLYSFIEELLGEQWILVDRYTRFFANGHLFKYPNDLMEVLTKFGPLNIAHALVDFSYERARTAIAPRHMNSFEDYAISNFGRTLAQVNIINYTEKVWGLPCAQISVEWAKQRIKGLSIRAIVEKSFLKKEGPKTLVDQFYYPDMGTGLIYENIQRKIEAKDKIHLNASPTKVLHDGKRITEVQFSDEKGKISKRSPEWLLTSIPMTEFTRMLDPAPPQEVLDALSKLRYRSQVFLFITVNKPHISPDQWIYFPQLEIPFGRISEMKNFSAKMSPPDKTSLMIEFFCWEGDETWNAPKETIFERAIEWLDKLDFVKRGEVINYYTHKQRNVYPVYDLEYDKNLQRVKDYLNQFENLEYMGRPGRFKYTNQDHSLEMGILAARTIIEGKKYNLDLVGAENEYFEKGTIGKQSVY